jgi:L-asparaginase/Glu-tRNA(Gln) amidotransferase subunit D
MNRRCCARASALSVLVTVVLLAAALAADAAEPPRVLLIATGGTISNRAGGRLTAQELTQAIPTLGRYVRAETEQFANVSSSEVTLDQWLQLARHINERYQKDADLSGIVIAAAGAGAIAPDQAAGLAYAASKGVFVVTATRTGSGRQADGL